MRNWWLIISAAVAVSCGPSTEQRYPAKIAGERKNSQGEVIQQIIVQVSFTGRTHLLTPEGPTKIGKYKVAYFLKEGDRPKRELLMLAGDEPSYYERFCAVEDSGLWVGAGINPVSNQNTGHVAVLSGRRTISHNENDLHVIVFDDKRVRSRRLFSVVPKWESSEDEFRFEHGNQTLTFNSPQGLKKYEALTDTVSSMKQSDDTK